MNPSFAPAYALLGNSLSACGRAEEAIPHIETAIRLNPHDPVIGGLIYTRMARAHLFLQRHEEAVKWARRSIRNRAFNWPTLAYFASALAHLDRLDEAHRALDEMNEREPGITVAFVRERTPVTDTGYMDHFLDGLRKAGLPEN